MKGLDNLTYYYTSKSAPKFFACFKSLLVIYNDIKNGQISSQKKKIKNNFDQR